MFNFNLKQTAIYQAVKLEPIFKSASFFKRVFKFVFLVLFLLFLFGFLSESFFPGILSALLGFSIISLIFFIALWWKGIFFELKLKRPELKAVGDNLAEFLNFETAKAVGKAEKFAQRKNVPLNSSILFYFLLSGNPKLNFIFARAVLNLEIIKKTLKNELNQSGQRRVLTDFQDTILEALKIASQRGRQRITIGDILIGLAKHNKIFERILIEGKLNVQDIENLTWWQEKLEEKIEERKKWWEYRNLLKMGGLAKEWTAGYTVTLDRYSADLTDVLRRSGFEEIIGHKAEVESIERILSRLEFNNVLLVGQPGVGRGSVIEAITQKSFFGQSSPELNYKRVVELNIPSLISQIEDAEETEFILDKVLQEAVLAGNVILIIPEFHNFVGGPARPGAVDISGILYSYLKLPQFQIIAVTTYAGLHKYIEKNPSLLSLFEKVEVSEISQQETMRLLEALSLRLETKYKRLIAYPAIRDVFILSERYMPSIPFPKKAMDLLSELVVYVVHSTKDKLVLPEHVAKVVSERTEIPVGEIETKEKEILLGLENLIHQRIINQDEAVREVSTALRRARAEITVRKGPMGCFLFLGPTGVGKTETSKALAEIYFRAESRMLRLDMSEFQAVKDIPRLIGSSEEEGLLTTSVRENPFSLILLDEIEKAHPNILNLFLQVLDEGHLTDGLGRKVNFSNTIIIATSNAGAEIIWKDIRQNKDLNVVKQELLDYFVEKRVFRPEFINRFDAVVVFRPLSKENLLGIAGLLFEKLKKNLKEKGIEFVVTQQLKERMVELGYDPTFGARSLRRVIQDKVENVLAQAMLSGELRKGDKITIEPQNFKMARFCSNSTARGFG